MLIKSYDTESKSRNADFILIAPKGETTHYILRVASLRGPPIGGQENDRVSYPCSNPYTLSRFAGLRPGGKHVTGFSGRFALLQIQFLCHLKGKRGTWREKQASHILHVPFRCFPLWCLTAPPFPRKRGHYKAPLCCERLLKGLLCGALLSHRSAGGKWWRQPPKGGKPPEVADYRNAYHVI